MRGRSSRRVGRAGAVSLSPAGVVRGVRHRAGLGAERFGGRVRPAVAEGRRVLRILIPAVFFLAACAPDSAHEVHPPQIWTKATEVTRRFVPVSYDTLWSYGSLNDTLLAMPGELLAAPRGGVFLFDHISARVMYFNANGEAGWSWGRKGQGPGELMDVRAMSIDHGGGVVLVDQGNRRLIRLSPSGALILERPLEIEATYVDGIARRDGGYVLYTNGDVPWVLLDEDGGGSRHLPAPSQEWEEMDFYQRMGHLAAWSDDAWVFGFEVGNGWYVFREDSVVANPYVEHTDFPVLTVAVMRESNTTTTRKSVERVPGSALNLSVRGDTLAVFFEGISPHRARTLDLYNLGTGAYIQSLPIPRATSAVLGGNGVIYSLSRGELSPLLRAFQPRRSP